MVTAMVITMVMMMMMFQRFEGHAERKLHRICGMNIKTPTVATCSEC